MIKWLMTGLPLIGSAIAAVVAMRQNGDSTGALELIKSIVFATFRII